MILKQLALTHYRNYEQTEIVAAPHVNIFIGANAQGKTNLLEAIYVLALTKSHRTFHDKELIGWNKQEAAITGQVEKKYGLCQLELMISKQGKRAKVNHLEQKKLSNFIGQLNVVLFAPEDLNIVKGSPGIRRRFIDMEIGQIYPSYLYDLTQYQKLIMQKSNYLKQISSLSPQQDTLLDVWNEQIAQYSIKIMKKRQSFIGKLQVWAEALHSNITSEKEQIEIIYVPSFEISENEQEPVLLDKYMIKLTQVKEQEIRRKLCLVGPHRDDLKFHINGKDVQIFGSQGQQRTTALSVKLAEIELIREETGEYPILLLDDVLSELDQFRQKQLIETFQNKVQTFITTTGVESVMFNKLEQASLYHVAEGIVSKTT